MPDPEIDVLLLAGRFEVRGSSAYSLRLATGLPEHGISARVIASDARVVTPAARQALNIHEYTRLETPVWGCLMRHFVLQELKPRPPQLIHIQTHRLLSVGQWLARRLQLPFVLTVHEHLPPGLCFRLDLQRCRRVIAVSDSVRYDLVQRLGVPEERMTTVPSGVDATSPHGLALPLEPGHVPVIATAGPLEPIKGIPYFLGAARQVLDVRRQVEFLVAGSGPEEGNLRRIARELGITEKVTFVPTLRSFTDALAATDIFCLPSLQQGLGTTMLEAMALGRPVIASEVGGVASVIRNRQTGLLVSPRNSGQLARSMLELLDNPALARAIGNQARKQVLADYNVAHMVQKTAEIYRETLDAR